MFVNPLLEIFITPVNTSDQHQWSLQNNTNLEIVC